MSEFSLYLASQSPRRRELLTQIGITFDVVFADIDESVKANEIPQDYVTRLAREKALAVWNLEKSVIKPVLGSDTSVVINGKILGKPENKAAAIKMLNLLSGKTHQVMTAVALAIPSQNSKMPELSSILSVSDVSFKELSNDEIERYVASGECFDKAGSYGIQGYAGAFISHLSGSYSGVMGLPLYETAELLNKAGIN